jgi:hypothetical protein
MRLDTLFVQEDPMRLLRPIVVFALVLSILPACGGGSNQASDQVSDQTSGPTSLQTETTSTDQVSDSEMGSSEGEASVDNTNSISYTISGGYEASGEQPLIQAMTYFDNGIWTMAFGDADEGGSALLILGLDPSTPSINFTDGKAAVAGDASTCVFDITRQDATGASGSFSCSDVAVVDSGVLTQADEFSGTFDANP